MFFCTWNKNCSTTSCFSLWAQGEPLPKRAYTCTCSWTSFRLFVLTQTLASAYTCRGIFIHCLNPQWRREDFFNPTYLGRHLHSVRDEKPYGTWSLPRPRHRWNVPFEETLTYYYPGFRLPFLRIFAGLPTLPVKGQGCTSFLATNNI